MKQFRAHFERHGDAAEIFIYEPIGDFGWGDGVSASRFVEDLRALGDVEGITVRLNSPGGYVFDGHAIYSALKAHEAPVTVYVDGLAASMASVIAMAADPGRLVMRENAMMMIHKPWSVAVGNADDMRKEADTLDQIQKSIVAAYRSRTELTDEELEAAMAAETWMTAEEAVEFGFADSTDQPLAVAASVDLSRFGNAPASKMAVPALPKAEQPANQEPESTGVTTEKEDIMSQSKTPAGDAGDFKAQEKQRRAEIREIFDAADFGTKYSATLDACLDDLDCTPEQARARLLGDMAANAEPLGADPKVEAGIDSRDKFRAAASNVLAARMGVADRDPANELNGSSLVDLARANLKHAGTNVRGMNADEIARRVLNVHTTADFPELLADVANKRLRDAYEVAPSVWDRFCYVSSVSDFKAVKRPQLGSFSNLETIPEGGDYTFGTFNEESESITASTKGKGLKVSRQMIVNDDLGAFDRAAAALGFAAGRAVARDVFSTLNANGNLSDAVALFATARGNLAGSGAAISTSTLNAAKAAIRKYQNGSDYLNLMPRFLLVPPEIEGTALEWMNSTANPTTNKNSGNVNVHANSMEVLCDAYLSDTGISGSTTAWYCIVDPMIAPLMEVAFLNGVRTPYTDDEVDFGSDAMLFKVRLDYGVAKIDWRGGYKNAGS